MRFIWAHRACVSSVFCCQGSSMWHFIAHTDDTRWIHFKCKTNLKTTADFAIKEETITETKTKLSKKAILMILSYVQKEIVMVLKIN